MRENARAAKTNRQDAKIAKLRFDLGPSQYTDADQKKTAEAVARAKD